MLCSLGKVSVRVFWGKRRRNGEGRGVRYLAAMRVSKAAFLAASSVFAVVSFLMRSSWRPDSFMSSATWVWRVLVVEERESRMWDSW